MVNKNVPDHAVVVGNPAKQVGWACKCGERLTADLKCPVCEQKYEKVGENVEELAKEEAKSIATRFCDKV